MKLFLMLCLNILILIPMAGGGVDAQTQPDIVAIAWSPDGALLATGHRDGRIRLYDSRTGQLNTILQVHTGQVLSLAWNSDGTRLVSGSSDETIIVWDILRRQTIISGRAIATLNQHDDVQDVDWSPDDSYLIIVGGFENMRVWNTSSWEEIANYPLGASFQIAFDPTNPQRLLVPNVFGEIYIVDTTSFQIVQTLSSYTDDTARHLYSVVWNSQGSQIATGSLGGTVYLWDVNTNQLLFQFQGNESQVVNWAESSIQGVAFSSDDSLLTSISSNGTLRTWDTTTGEVIETTQLDGPIYAAEWSPDGSQIAYGGSGGTFEIIPAPSTPNDSASNEIDTDILSLAWSPDGEALALEYQDGSVRVVEVDSGQEMFHFQRSDARTGSLAWNSDGSQLAAGGVGSEVYIWDMSNGQRLAILDSNSVGVSAITWNVDGSQILTWRGDTGEHLQTWDAGTFELIEERSEGGDVNQVAWSPDQTQMVLASAGGIAILDAYSLQETIGMDEPEAEGGGRYIVLSVAWSPDGSYVVSGNTAGTIRFWDVETGEIIRNLQATEHQNVGIDETFVVALQFSADGNQLFSIAADGTLRTWDTTTGAVIETTQLDGPIYAAEWSPDGSQIAYGGSSGTYTIIPAPSGGSSESASPTTNDQITAVAWSPDGTMIVGGGTNGLLQVWDVSGSLILDIPNLIGTAFFAVWSPDSQKIAAVGHDTNVRVWNVSDPQYSPGTLLATFQGHIDRPEEIAWSPDGTRLASVSVYGESRVFIWDVVSFQPQPIAQTTAAESYAVAWSPDSQQLAIGSSAGVLIFDANLNNTTPLINYILGPINSVISIAWSPDGNHIIAGYFDPEVIIYDLVTNTQQNLQGHTDYVEAVTWSHDGTRIATSSGDDSVRIWNASTGEELTVFSNIRDVGTKSIAWSPDDTQIAFGGTSQGVRIESSPNISPDDIPSSAD